MRISPNKVKHNGTKGHYIALMGGKTYEKKIKMQKMFDCEATSHVDKKTRAPRMLMVENET